MEALELTQAPGARGDCQSRYLPLHPCNPRSQELTEVLGRLWASSECTMRADRFVLVVCLHVSTVNPRTSGWVQEPHGGLCQDMPVTMSLVVGPGPSWETLRATEGDFWRLAFSPTPACYPGCSVSEWWLSDVM